MGVRRFLAVTALAAAPLAAQAAVYVETFESYPVAPGTFNTYVPPATFGGWTVGGAGVDIVSATYSGAWPAVDTASLDLNALDTGSIARTITGLTAGTEYVVSFLYAANQDSLSEPFSARPFSVGFGTASDTFSPTSYGPLVSGSLLFTATSDSAVLQFSSLAGGARGAVLDDITVAAVPEPHEWAMMLAGLGIVGWVAKRRREPGASALAAA